MTSELAVTSAVASPSGRVGGPLPLADLAALLRAASSLCGGVEGRDHNVLTATYTVVDRVKLGNDFPELAGLQLDDAARFQVARALCWAVFGRIPDNPVAAAVRWQFSIDTNSAAMLGQMLETAAKLVTLEAAKQGANERAAALLGVTTAQLEGVDEDAGSSL